MDKKTVRKEIINFAFILLAAIIHALGLWIFVYPAKFASLGVDGITTMLYQITGVNAGYYSIIINGALLVAAWFVLKKRYVIYTVAFILFSSLALILCEGLHLYQYGNANDGVARMLASAVSGILLGLRTGIMLMIGASSGGADIIAGMVQVKKPYLKVEKVITAICYVIIGFSFFLYRDLDSILYAVLHAVTYERGVAWVLKDQRNAVKFEIVTQNAEALKEDILLNLKHGATIVGCKGMFTDEQSNIIISVVNQRQIPEFLSIIKKYPNTFVYYTDVVGVSGNFRWKRDDIAK